MADEAARLFAGQLRPAWQDRALLLRLRARYVADHPESGPWMLDEAQRPPDRSPARGAPHRSLLADASALVDSMRATAPPSCRWRSCCTVASATMPDAATQATASSRGGGRDPVRRRAPVPRGGVARGRTARRRTAATGAASTSPAVAGWTPWTSTGDGLGDVELRALASGHGVEFTRLAVSEAVRSDRHASCSGGRSGGAPPRSTSLPRRPTTRGCAETSPRCAT